ncbi:MAG TPA: DUF5985 family protein [Abditibacteriaceae bacterium]|jgi:hypothetical protein
MSDFISGALVMGYLVAGLYFLRFWKQTRDRLFVFFGVSFWLLALQRFALFYSTHNSPATPDAAERHTIFYLIRLAAFALILIAIIDKNRAASRPD